MSDHPLLDEEKSSTNGLVLAALFSSNFALAPQSTITGLLLIDIGSTFDAPVGVMGQIATAYSIAALVFALLMGALALRFKHRSLLIAGLLLVNISVLGSGLAWDFNAMLVFSSLVGLGSAMVSPMTITMVADHFPLEKRTHAIGWSFAGASLAYVVGAPVISFIAGLRGWRWAFLGFALPVTLLSLLLAVKGLPSAPRNQQVKTSKGDYLKGFRGILTNRSAIACLIGAALSAATFQGFLSYSSSFFRQRFLIPTARVSLLLMISAFLFTVGSLLAGRLVNRAGRRSITVIAAFLTGILSSYYGSTDLWLAICLSSLFIFFGGVRATASNSLVLEQVPRFRGTMMSINSAAMYMGASIGAGLGGLALLLLDYEGLGVILGAIGVAAAVVFQLLVIDPTRAPAGSTT